MKKLILAVYDRFLGPQLGFRVRLFNVLAMAGLLIGFVTPVMCLLNGEGPASAAANFVTAPLAFVLMHYASRTGKYRMCYKITIVGIFMVAFSVIFILGGAYHGAMPAFFIFAAVFTVVMLDGKEAFFFVAAELALYTGLCIYAYRFPQNVHFHHAELDRLIDTVVGFVIAGVSLAVTLSIHFRMYNRQQAELEQARRDAEKASQAKTSFLANMSHEMRTPVNVMLGMNEMILRESSSEQITAYGTSVQKSGKTLLSLINNVLDVSKIESGKFQLYNEAYKTEDLIFELSLVGVECAGKSGLRFVCDADPALPAWLMGDFVRIKQVGVNLLSNAAKYTPEGSFTLSLSHRPTPDGAGTVLVLSVADTGVGIREEDQPLLFSAFTRIDLPANRNIEGTGLGLAICRQLTHLMGGSISVNSQWGRGSTFTAEIPQALCGAEQAGHRQDDAPQPGSFIAPKGRVLAVDDSPENLQVLKSLLARTMIGIDTAQSGEECLRLAAQNQYHVILLDYMMPNMDGIETLHRLQDQIPGFSVPVVALTANAVSGARQMLLDAGFSLYLPKPVVWNELEEALLAYLPKDLITKTVPSANSWVTEAMLGRWRAGLAAHDISLDEGLRYLNNDIVQYSEIAGFFVQNLDADRSAVQARAAAGDWAAMAYSVHSLKSKAKAVGALDLHYIAARLEKRCHDGDGEYIQTQLPLLYLEWRRAKAGLEAFIAAFSAAAPGGSAFSAEAPRWGDLLPHIRGYRHSQAAELLAAALGAMEDGPEKDALLKVARAVDELDFEKAEALLLAANTLREVAVHG